MGSTRGQVQHLPQVPGEGGASSSVRSSVIPARWGPRPLWVALSHDCPRATCAKRFPCAGEVPSNTMIAQGSGVQVCKHSYLVLHLCSSRSAGTAPAPSCID